MASRSGEESKIASIVTTPFTELSSSADEMSAAATATATAVRLMADLGDARREAAEEIALSAGAASSRLDAARAEVASAGAAVERAARVLAVRALEIDNKEGEVGAREDVVRSVVEGMQREVGLREGRVLLREREVGRREVEVEGREAGIRFSAVEEGRLARWAEEVREREELVGEREKVEGERLDKRRALGEARERAVVERVRVMEEGIETREIEVAAREQEVEKMRKDVRLELEKARSEFWAHQQTLSAVVAGETDSLVREQEKLREEFEEQAAAARAGLRAMKAEVEKLEGEMQTLNDLQSLNLEKE